MHVNLRLKLFYGIGAFANGVKTDAFTYFLLFFYANVVGLAPALASLAILIALMVDAFTDPLMGLISDRTSTKYGKRHPFFLLAVMPVSLSFYLLFSINTVSGWTQSELFIWILTFTILTRLGMTMFEVPHRAFGAEISSSYTQRTSIFAFREQFTWIGGLTNALLAYGFFLRDTPAYIPGTRNPEPWDDLALVGSFMMLATILISFFGTLKYSNISVSKAVSFSVKEMLHSTKKAIGNKSFKLFFFGYLFIASGWGMGSSLQLYMNTYVWEFQSNMIMSFLFVYFAATFTAFIFIPILGQYFEKKTLLLWSIALAGLVHALPVIFFFNQWLPPVGTWDLFMALAPFVFFANAPLAASAIIRESMLGDVSDEVHLETGKDQRGLIFASSSLIGKINTGLGIFISGMALQIINFPRGTGATPSNEAITNLALLQGPFVSILLVIPFFIFSFYSIDKRRHQEILNRIGN
ncbi:MAG: MFS transporter [Gammaproteobacteria bacterium]